MGVLSLVLPVLAVPSIICAVIAWVKSLLHPSVPGRSGAARAFLAVMLLSPVGVFAIGEVWANTAPNLTNFGSGTEIRSVPLMSPGRTYALVSSQYGSNGGGTPPTTSVNDGYLQQIQSGDTPTQVVEVSNQTATATWATSGRSEVQSTILILAPSPVLGQSVTTESETSIDKAGQGVTAFPVASPSGAFGAQVTHLAGSPGVTQILIAGRGSVTVIMAATGSSPVAKVRAGMEARMSAQLNTVPPSLIALNKTSDSYESRHNLVYRVVKDLVMAFIPLIGLFALLGLLSLVVDVSRKLASRKHSPARGWYRDPTGRFEVREWSGRKWTGRVVKNGRPARDRLVSKA
jgi:hypothetical protein